MSQVIPSHVKIIIYHRLIRSVTATETCRNSIEYSILGMIACASINIEYCEATDCLSMPQNIYRIRPSKHGAIDSEPNQTLSIEDVGTS